jgi:hypothetical protein
VPLSGRRFGEEFEGRSDAADLDTEDWRVKCEVEVAAFRAGVADAAQKRRGESEGAMSNDTEGGGEGGPTGGGGAAVGEATNDEPLANAGRESATVPSGDGPSGGSSTAVATTPTPQQGAAALETGGGDGSAAASTSTGAGIGVEPGATGGASTAAAAPTGGDSASR